VTGPIHENSFRAFQDRSFSGATDLKRNVTEHKPRRLHKLAAYTKDDMASLRWSLPPGVVVLFYDHSNARGAQAVIWGEGEVECLATWWFSDIASRWTWVYVGGVDDVPRKTLDGRASRPLGSRPTRAPLPDDAMFIYRGNGFKGERQTVDGVTGRPAGELQPITAWPDGSLHSLQWRLPYGVVVVFYEKADRSGRLFAIWGSGELRSASRWGSDGTVAGWSWFFVGSPEAAASPGP
jgi:hypothetical protein